jgi:hypothetical protein
MANALHCVIKYRRHAVSEYNDTAYREYYLSFFDSCGGGISRAFNMPVDQFLRYFGESSDYIKLDTAETAQRFDDLLTTIFEDFDTEEITWEHIGRTSTKHQPIFTVPADCSTCTVTGFDPLFIAACRGEIAPPKLAERLARKVYLCKLFFRYSVCSQKMRRILFGSKY